MSRNPFAASYSDEALSGVDTEVIMKKKKDITEEQTEESKSSEGNYRRSNQAVAETPKALRRSLRKPPPPKQRVNSYEKGTSYSQELFGEDKGLRKNPTMKTNDDDDIVSVPTELGDREDPDDYLQAAAEVKNRVAEEQKFEKAKTRYKKKQKLNLTRIVGTKKYNPFAFGSSVGSLVSAVGSNFETKKKKDLRRALYADDPLELYLVKGWFKLLAKDDQGDTDSLPSANAKAVKNRMPFFGKPNKSKRAQQDPARPMRGKEDSCYGMFMSCVKGLMGAQEEQPRERLASGDTDLDQSVSPSEAEILAVRQSYKPSVRKSSVFRGECVSCHRRVKARDQLTADEGNDEEAPLHRDCVCCDLCRVRVTTVVALRAREKGEPVLCNKCSINVTQTQEAQLQLHSESTVAKKNQYLALVPAGYKLFLPVQVKVGTTGSGGKGMIAMCTNCGSQLRKSDKDTRIQGSERFHVKCPKPERLRTILKSDMKMIAASLQSKIELSLKGFNGMLRNPIVEHFTFKRDEASLQFELRQAVKAHLKIIYNLYSPSVTRPALNLDQVRASSLIYTGALTEDLGPFLGGHEILKQEKGSRLTGKSVELHGKYEHGILYDFSLKMFHNEETNTMTPVSIELALRIPQLY